MKIRNLSIAFLLAMSMPVIVFSQAKERDKTAMEIFSEKSGLLTKREFFDVGKVGKLKVGYMIITDLNDNKSISGVRMEYETYSSVTGSDTKIAFIDKDELNGMISSLQLMKEKIFPSTPQTYTEVSYTSKGGMSASCYLDSKNKWSVVVKLEKFDSRSNVYLSQSEVDQLIELLKTAQSKL